MLIGDLPTFHPNVTVLTAIQMQCARRTVRQVRSDRARACGKVTVTSTATSSPSCGRHPARTPPHRRLPGGVADAVRCVKPPRATFVVHEAVASVDIEKLDTALHRNLGEEEQDTNSGRVRHPISRACRACGRYLTRD